MNTNDTKSGRKEKDKGQHIQVFTRVRPINDLEKSNKSKNIIEIPNDKELVVHERLHDKYSKKFKFDHVFGPSSKQIELYDIVVRPLVEQVLAGYNCTVLAYGQTGTGKTFTMKGNSDFSGTLNWQADSAAGMIPRALSHLFDKLQLMKAQEYNIRVSFLELYNEELFDLLSPNCDGSKIRLYEDASKKGTIIIQGLEETTIQNKSEIFHILEKGSERRQTTATLMNAQSSRSHTVFSVTVHMKETTVKGDEVLKTGKLNLVDLAGSENIGRSGSVDRRAKEAGSINQSLLTLGRVITALVERTPHIPYRESKLTRLLQESLGGRTKTSIIATVSPASINIDETISTLDYAHRAKNIKNRPEINQKLSKKEFLKQYSEEIEKLQRDLLATRERTGVYLADENYKQLQSLISQQNKEIETKINHIKALEKAMEDKERIFDELERQNREQTKKLHEVKVKLTNASAALDTTNQRLKLSAQELNEQKYLVEKYVNTEKSLLNQGETLLNVANTATEDSYKLHEKIARKNETERVLEAQAERFQKNVSDCMEEIKNDTLAYIEKLKVSFSSTKSELDMETLFNCESLQRTGNQLSTALSEAQLTETNNLTSNIEEPYLRLQDELRSIATNQTTTMESEDELVKTKFLELAKTVEGMIDEDVERISSNLTAMRSSVSEKLKETSEIINKLTDSACEQQLKIHNETCENVQNVQENVKIIREMSRLTEKQQLFSEMMRNAYAQFNDLKRSEEEHRTDIRDKCHRLNELCTELNGRTTDSYNANSELRNILREQLREGIGRIENDAVGSTKQNEEVVEQIKEQGTFLINELISSVNESSRDFQEYKNKVNLKATEIQSKVNEDSLKTLSLIKDSQVVIADVSKNQVSLLNDKIIETSDATRGTSEKLATHMTEFTAQNDNVKQKLQELENDIHKFFYQDIQREVPTGTTPSRREFSYPRQFTATSPHERILQKFRETKKLVEGSESDEEDTTLRNLANSMALSDTTLTTSPPDSSILTMSTDSTRYSMNSTISNVTRTSDSSTMSVMSGASFRKCKDST